MATGQNEPSQTSPKGSVGTSRRSALKLGVGMGVGAAAWSGGSITSLGGTPAYAAGCTFVVDLTLSGCRNTNRGGPSQFRYTGLSTGSLPAGYQLRNPIPRNTACSSNWVSRLVFPAGLTCQATLRFNLPPSCRGANQGTLTYGPSSSSPLRITFRCLPGRFRPNTEYSLVASCNTTGAPLSCLN